MYVNEAPFMGAPIVEPEGPKSTHKNNGFAAEWRTVALGIVIYGSWILVLLLSTKISVWLVVPCAACVLCWHTHFQHECIHGHPTNRRWLNDLFAAAPLSLWIPYTVYRDSHLAHHAAKKLTDPLEDPESFFVNEEYWDRASIWFRALLYANQTLAGRLTIGPFLCVISFWKIESLKVWRAEAGARGTWLKHIFFVGLVLTCVGLIGVNPLTYILYFVLPSISLALLRSFAEHHEGSNQAQRTMVVRSNRFFQMLFLNNNFHSVHHHRPRLPWYKIPTVFDAESESILDHNGNAYFSGYAALARKWLFKPKAHPAHSANR